MDFLRLLLFWPIRVASNLNKILKKPISFSPRRFVFTAVYNWTMINVMCQQPESNRNRPSSRQSAGGRNSEVSLVTSF